MLLFEHLSASGRQSRVEHYVPACLYLWAQKELEFHSWIFKGDSWSLAFVFLVPLTLCSIGLNSLRGQSSATTSLIEFCSVGVATRLEKWTSFLGSECPLLVWQQFWTQKHLASMLDLQIVQITLVGSLASGKLGFWS